MPNRLKSATAPRRFANLYGDRIQGVGGSCKLFRGDKTGDFFAFLCVLVGCFFGVGSPINRDSASLRREESGGFWGCEKGEKSPRKKFLHVHN